MHIFFSGIGGTAIGPLALIAKQAGYEVSGSDKQASTYTEHLKKAGIASFHIGQTEDQIRQVHQSSPIDLLVYSSAVEIEQPHHPELEFCRSNNITAVKRDQLINILMQQKNLDMIAIAGTHGKTTTTAMTIWLFKQLGIPVSYSVGAKIPFGEMGHYDARSTYFVYEADEYDRNFLAFQPALSIIAGIDWDHPDIYPTREEYYEAFLQFIDQSQRTYLWEDDASKIGVTPTEKIQTISARLDSRLLGKVNRENATIAAHAISALLPDISIKETIDILDSFPGLSRRFEEIAPHIYSDYAHTPEKIKGGLQIAKEAAGDKKITVVYEGLHNTRQHFIKAELPTLFTGADEVFVVPSYRAREDESLEDLTPIKLCQLINPSTECSPSKLDKELKTAIQDRAQSGIVVCFSAGGGGSLDEWARQNF